ncbi:MAG: hypothetical protein ABIT01_14815 [Thermoanaerobaculia bacterium]
MTSTPSPMRRQSIEQTRVPGAALAHQSEAFVVPIADGIDSRALDLLAERLWRFDDPEKAAAVLSQVSERNRMLRLGLRYLQSRRLEAAMVLFLAADAFPHEELLAFATRCENEGRSGDAERARAAAGALPPDQLIEFGRRVAVADVREAIQAFRAAGATSELRALATERQPLPVRIRALAAAGGHDELVRLGRSFESVRGFAEAIQLYVAAGATASLEALGDYLSVNLLYRHHAIRAYESAGATHKLVEWGDRLLAEDLLDEAAELYLHSGVREKVVEAAQQLLKTGTDRCRAIALDIYRQLGCSEGLREAAECSLDAGDCHEAFALYREAVALDVLAAVTSPNAAVTPPGHL